MSERTVMPYDVVIVGAGPSGLVRVGVTEGFGTVVLAPPAAGAS